MEINSIKFLFCVAFLGLSACSSGGGVEDYGEAAREASAAATPDPEDNIVIDIPERTYRSELVELRDVLDDIGQLDLDGQFDLPVSGSANYSGHVTADVAGLGVIGDLEMRVGFADESITGTASNFIDSNNAEYKGALTIGNGLFDRTADPNTDFQTFAEINGTIRGGGDRLDVSGIMAGWVAGENQEAVLGGIFGQVESRNNGLFDLTPDNTSYFATR